jgi:FkbM family methyltransferase
MSLLPDSILPSLVRNLPKLQAALPPGRKFRIDHYLGDLKVDIDTTFVIERAMLSGRYDPQTLSVIDRMARDGDYCLDIGANVGAIAFALAKKAGPSGRVLAFEPGLLTYERLVANLALNPGFSGILKPIQLGLSDRPGTLHWVEHGDNRGNANLAAEAGPGTVPVPVTTLDDYLRENPIDRLDFVKIDVESMEYEVIRGGMETWSRFRPVIYYETLPAFEAYRGKPVFRMIEEMLRPLGYAFYKITGRDSFVETSYPDLSANTLAVPTSRKDRLFPG